ncbi:MAG: metalloregulator ArsR/SmtB family transcription factor [Candidatus Ozemobacteraceae bacterium]
MRAFLLMTKALADETRLRMLVAMQQGELCICQLIELMKLAPSTVSRHLELLYQAGLIEKRKCGKWIYCRLANSKASAAVKTALKWVFAEIGDVEIVQRDVTRLAKIKQISPEDLCTPRKQKRSSKSK